MKLYTVTEVSFSDCEVVAHDKVYGSVAEAQYQISADLSEAFEDDPDLGNISDLEWSKWDDTIREMMGRFGDTTYLIKEVDLELNDPTNGI